MSTLPDGPPVMCHRECNSPRQAPPRACAAARCERDAEERDFVRPGGQLLNLREWGANALVFGEYSLDLDCLNPGFRSELLRMGFECFETCRAQGCEGLLPFNVCCIYSCAEWHAFPPRICAPTGAGRRRWRGCGSSRLDRWQPGASARHYRDR